MPTHQQYYEVLGLDAPPEDRKAVKRAYSKMLKTTRPEDDPEGFMRLRDAHDQALNIIQWQTEDRDWDAQQSALEQPPALQPVEAKLEPESESKSKTEAKTNPESNLTYGDLIPQPESEPESDTSYSIGATPNFDAPVTLNEFAEPAAKPLIEELSAMLEDPKKYNDREQWNHLFRGARQLDIDDYVDFENALLENILRFQGYFEDHPYHNTPHKMPIKLSPSIAASLFKTMSWDQVNKRDHYRSNQIEWLERRMSLRKRGTDPLPIPQSSSGGNGNVWFWLIGVFVVLKIIQALANI